MVQDYWQILHKYTVNINLLIIGFDWVSKFTLSLLSALKVSITFGLLWMGFIVWIDQIGFIIDAIQIQWYRYIIHLYLHGKLNQRKGDKYLRLNQPGYEVDSMWNLKPLHQKQTRMKLDIWGGFLPQKGWNLRKN